MSSERDNDNDLQRGFEPLRTAFALLVLAIRRGDVLARLVARLVARDRQRSRRGRPMRS